MSDPPFRISVIPGKGYGLIAARNIALGELIVAEKPLMKGKFISEKVDVMSLCDSHSPYRPSLHNIVQSNLISAGPTAEYGAIYKTICRINHSCTPNVSWAWQDRYEQQHVYAITDITEGTEICVNYIVLFCGRGQRQLELIEKYNFVCECPTCLLPEDDKSDRRRESLSLLNPVIEKMIRGDPSNNTPPNPIQGLYRCKEGIRSVDEEGMVDKVIRSNGYASPAVFAEMCHDVEKAKRYRSLSYVYSMISWGPDHKTTVERLGRYKGIEKQITFITHLGEVPKLPIICDACGKAETGKGTFGDKKGGDCPRCNCMVYCSVVCRKAHFGHHQAVCEVLANGAWLKGQRRKVQGGVYEYEGLFEHGWRTWGTGGCY